MFSLAYFFLYLVLHNVRNNFVILNLTFFFKILFIIFTHMKYWLSFDFYNFVKYCFSGIKYMFSLLLQKFYFNLYLQNNFFFLSKVACFSQVVCSFSHRDTINIYFLYMFYKIRCIFCWKSNLCKIYPKDVMVHI